MAKTPDPVADLIRAAKAAWNALLAWGPTDDGTAEGKAVEDKMTALAAAAELCRKHRRRLRPKLRICVRARRTEGGRGRNAVHWQAVVVPKGTPGDMCFALHGVRAQSYEGVVGKVVCAHLDGGGLPPLVEVVYLDTAETPGEPVRG